MLTTIALAVLTAMQSAAPVVPPVLPAPVAIESATPPSDEHISRAKKALEQGDFAEARREYVIASALERDAGKVPVEASFGLAHVLYAQGYNREAAVVLDRLAEDAQTAGDRDTEARALVDAMWLNHDAKQFMQARNNAIRLRALLKEGQLSPETRRAVMARLS